MIKIKSNSHRHHRCDLAFAANVALLSGNVTGLLSDLNKAGLCTLVECQVV